MTIKPCKRCGSIEKYKDGRCKPCRLKAQAEWRNRPCVREILSKRPIEYYYNNTDKAKKYKQENKQRNNDVHREWVRRNREHRNRYARDFYHALTDDQKEEKRKKQRDWEQRNKPIVKAQGARKRTKGKKIKGVITKEIAIELFEKYDYCLRCGTKEDLTIDHIIAITNGGSDEWDNLQILCFSCNSSKGNRHSTDYRPK